MKEKKKLKENIFLMMKKHIFVSFSLMKMIELFLLYTMSLCAKHECWKFDNETLILVCINFLKLFNLI